MERKKFNPTDWLKVDKSITTIRKPNGNTSILFERIEALIEVIEEQRLDITAIYADWRNIGFAFADEFGENGRSLFHRISQFYPEYSARECDKQFDHCLKSKGHGITIKTVFHLAKNAGIQIVSQKQPKANNYKSKTSMPSQTDHPNNNGQVEIGSVPQKTENQSEQTPIPLSESNLIESESPADKILRISEHKYWLEFHDPIPCIEVEVNEQKTAFGTVGNISVIKGPPKSRKTTFVSIILAAAIKNGCIQNTIRCNLPEDKRKIVVFDTEQGESHVNKVIKRAFAIAGISNDELKAYSEILFVHCLRPYSSDERVLAIERFVETHPGIGLVIIDGIRDLILDTNSIEQSAIAVQHLMRWSFEKQLHILTVIHVNKGDKNATGHLGGELTKKGETVAEVSRDKKFKNISLVKPTECRGMEFADLAFSIDDKGMPEIISYSGENDSIQRRKEIFPSDYEHETHIKALKIIFEKDSKLTSAAFHSSVVAAYQTIGIRFGESKARVFVAYVKQIGLVNIASKQSGNRISQPEFSR